MIAAPVDALICFLILDGETTFHFLCGLVALQLSSSELRTARNEGRTVLEADLCGTPGRDDRNSSLLLAATAIRHDTTVTSPKASAVRNISKSESKKEVTMKSICLKSCVSIVLTASFQWSAEAFTAHSSFSEVRASLGIRSGILCGNKHKNKEFFSQRLNYSSCSALQMSANPFDVSKPVFDLFALRQIRGDALLQYSTLNQSEPLRINLYGLTAITLFSAPFISEAVGGEAMNLAGTAASTLAGIGSMVLFVNECRKRSQQLTRIEKELNAEKLTVRLPASAIADRRYGQAESLLQLKRSSTPPRIIALAGTSSQLKEALMPLQVLGRRLAQSSTYVVPIPLDGSKRVDWGIGDTRTPWLAEACELDEWKEYFDGLAETLSGEFRWFGLNSNGRSFGSGSGDIPQWLQVLGQHLRPTELLDEDDEAVALSIDEKIVIECQKKFYKALTTGDLDTLTSLHSLTPSSQVSEVISSGGRIDNWQSCLEEGARPKGMRVSGSDAIIVSDTRAFSTTVEFPANTGIETATLLAIQQWTRSSAGEDWKLKLHQTIPWSPQSKAQGTLLCDCRGCVALTRSVERRTFGGVIG